MLRINEEEKFKAELGENFTIAKFMEFWDKKTYDNYDTYHIYHDTASGSTSSTRSIIDAIRTLIYYFPEKSFIQINKKVIKYLENKKPGYCFCGNIQKLILKQDYRISSSQEEDYWHDTDWYPLLNTRLDEYKFPVGWEYDDFRLYDDDDDYEGEIDWNRIEQEKEDYGWTTEVGEVMVKVRDWRKSVEFLDNFLKSKTKYPKRCFGNIRNLKKQIKRELKINGIRQPKPYQTSLAFPK